MMRKGGARKRSECEMAPCTRARNGGNVWILWVLGLSHRLNSMARWRQERSLPYYIPNFASWLDTSSRVMAGLLLSARLRFCTRHILTSPGAAARPFLTARDFLDMRPV